MHFFSFYFRFFYNNYNVKKIMLLVILSTIPGILVQAYYFNYCIILQILFSVALGVIFEIIFFILRNKPIKNIKDNSAILTSLLLGISLPPLSPWWIIFLSNFFALTLAKHIYGGLGKNIFNPAMTGYIIILVSFPIQMQYSNLRLENLNYFKQINLKTYINVVFKQNKINIENKFDILNQPTPLIKFKDFIKSEKTYTKKYLSNHSEKLILYYKINIGFLIGGIFLLLIGIISWHIPISFLFSLFLFSFITSFFYFDMELRFIDHFFLGSTMLGVFFIATDPVTSPITKKGKLIFGFIIGFFVWLIRVLGKYPDGIAFSILLSNSIVPLIDYYSQKSYKKFF